MRCRRSSTTTPRPATLLGAIPLEERFGYFGYLKKLMLTLHNLAVMKRGRMPFHGAFTHIGLRGGRSANVLLVGDTATGKSESLEALRQVGEARDRRAAGHRRRHGLARGRRGVGEGRPAVLGYGTEIGAFVRLDDLQRGYAFGQVDRAIIMSPQKINARVVLPVTTLDEVLRGYPVDFLLYANNYEEVDERHPMIERLTTLDEALRVFREGRAMSKGTTTSTGLRAGLLRQRFRARAAGRAARRDRRQGLRRRLRGRRLRGAVAHATGCDGLRDERAGRGGGGAAGGDLETRPAAGPDG